VKLSSVVRLGLADGAPVIGTVMRFAPEKDPHLWLETAAAIAAARPDSRFVLAGYGNLAKQVERKIDTLGLADRFILAGSKGRRLDLWCAGCPAFDIAIRRHAKCVD
jgi:glycosyltransferase involved in cell wall biosynthesis